MKIKCGAALAVAAAAAFAGPNQQATVQVDYDGLTSAIETQAPQVTRDQVIWVAVVAQSVRDLDTYSFTMTYDKTVLEFLKAAKRLPSSTMPAFLEQHGGNMAAFLVKPGEEGNSVNIAGSLVGKDRAQAPDGAGVLAYVRFKVLASGVAEVRLKNVKVWDSDQTADEVKSAADKKL